MLTDGLGRGLNHHWRVLRGTSLYRPLFRRYRAIFVHVPRTAGMSVAQALFDNPSYIGHHKLAEFERESPRKFDSYYKFTFVRDPYARLVSAYGYLMTTTDWAADVRLRETVLTKYRDFADFVRRGLPRDTAVRSDQHFVPQVDFLKDQSGRVRMDFIGRFENLAADYEYVRQRLGHDKPLGWLNKSPPLRVAYHHHYTVETAAIVADIYAEDFQALGYDKDLRIPATVEPGSG